MQTVFGTFIHLYVVQVCLAEEEINSWIGLINSLLEPTKDKVRETQKIE